MKKFLSFAVLFLACVTARAFDMPVPEELIGAQTLGVLHVNLNALKVEQAVKSLKDFGTAPDAQGVEGINAMLGQFKEAGGTGITVLFNAGKEADAANAGDGVVFVINKAEGASDEKLTGLLEAMGAPFKDKIAAGCPKKIGDCLVWHAAKFKLPKMNEDKANAFSEAYSHLAKDSSLSVVFVPDADALELAEAGMKNAKDEEKEMVKALFSATGYCLFSNFGASAEPSLKVLVLAADADGAAVLDKAATGLLAEGKKDAPPPVQKLLESFKLVLAGANVQLNVDLSELVGAVKAMVPAPEAAK